jgi:hypothetical protein
MDEKELQEREGIGMRRRGNRDENELQEREGIGMRRS